MGELIAKVDVQNTLKISWFGQRYLLTSCSKKFRDGVDETMKNVNWFIILFHVNN
jgi:hypothetical protein